MFFSRKLKVLTLVLLQSILLSCGSDKNNDVIVGPAGSGADTPVSGNGTLTQSGIGYNNVEITHSSRYAKSRNSIRNHLHRTSTRISVRENGRGGVSLKSRNWQNVSLNEFNNMIASTSPIIMRGGEQIKITTFHFDELESNQRCLVRNIETIDIYNYTGRWSLDYYLNWSNTLLDTRSVCFNLFLPIPRVNDFNEVNFNERMYAFRTIVNEMSNVSVQKLRIGKNNRYRDFYQIKGRFNSSEFNDAVDGLFVVYVANGQYRLLVSQESALNGGLIYSQVVNYDRRR